MPATETLDVTKIDKVFGRGEYELWTTLEDDFIDEQIEAYAHLGTFFGILVGTSGNRLRADVELGEAILQDYSDLLLAASNDEAVDPSAAKAIRDVFVLSISVIRAGNTLLRYLKVSGIALLLAKARVSGIEKVATKLKPALEELERKLKVAKGKVTEAYQQAAVNVMLTAVTAAIGPVGWMVRVGIGAGQLALDAYLGPDTSTLASGGSNAATVLGAYAESLNDYNLKHNKSIIITGKLGKAYSGVGLAFDVNEILVGYGGVAELERAIADVKKHHNEMVEALKREKANVEALAAKLKILQREMKTKLIANAVEIRQDMEAEMIRTGYDPR